MAMAETISLRARLAGGGSVVTLAGGGWRLGVPAGPSGTYRLAQVDDYAGLPRRRFPWRPPLRLRLRARVSTSAAAGTWGFGLWNDPFAVGLGIGGGQARLPTLPNCAWFFHASPPNHLAFRDGHPAHGFLAATFSANPTLPSLVSVGLAAVPALVSGWGGRLLRSRLRRYVAEDAAAVTVHVVDWHEYAMVWRGDICTFSVDGSPVLETAVSPRGPLACVLWIDNQYAALPPSGRLRFGSLVTEEPVSLELADIAVQTG